MMKLISIDIPILIASINWKTKPNQTKPPKMDPWKIAVSGAAVMESFVYFAPAQLMGDT